MLDIPDSEDDGACILQADSCKWSADGDGTFFTKLFFDPGFVDFIYNYCNSIVPGYVAGSPEGILGDLEGDHQGTDGAVGVSLFFPENHPEEGQGRHDGTAGRPRRSDHGNPQGHDEGDDRP